MELIRMATFDTPVHANDASWQKVLQQKLPLLLYLFNSVDARLDEELKRVARDHAGKLLVVRVNATENPKIYAQYNRPTLPALVAIHEGAVRSSAAPAQAADIAAHTAYVLGNGPKPSAKTASNATRSPMTVSDVAFQREVLQSDLPVLVDFWASWCGPCRMIAPIVEQMAAKYAGRIKVVKLNVDENPRSAAQYQATSIPMLILFKQNQIAGRLVGAHPQAAIEQMIDSALHGKA
jgi:thioredoxin